MIKILKLKIIILLVSFMIFFVPQSIFAANLFFNTQTNKLRSGERFEVDIFLYTESKDINAVEGTITFPYELLKLKEIKDGNSIILFWVEKPKVISKNKIHFSGIIPGGYAGNKGQIFSLIFQTLGNGNGTIKISDVRVLLNDGNGTEVNTSVSNLQVTISGVSVVPKTPILKKDNELPEPFKPIITKDPEIFDGKYFLVFATQDKGSGIDHYEVCEGKRKCIIAKSPYLIKNQKLNDKIIVKAIDKSGNERIAIVPAQNPVVWHKSYWIFVIITLVIVISYFLLKFLWIKNSKKR